MNEQVLPVVVWRAVARFEVVLAATHGASSRSGSTCAPRPCVSRDRANARWPTLGAGRTMCWSAGAYVVSARMLVTLILLLATSLFARAQGTNAPGRPDYQSFKILTERNIFDPNRSSGSGRRTETRRPTRVDSFALVGTLSYEKGTFAFFDGSDSSYKRALKTGDIIAGCRIAEITADRVKLETNGVQMELSVGMQMKKQDEGEWQLGGRAEFSGAPVATTAANEKTDGTNGGGESDVLKKLLQKREQELK